MPPGEGTVPSRSRPALCLAAACRQGSCYVVLCLAAVGGRRGAPVWPSVWLRWGRQGGRYGALGLAAACRQGGRYVALRPPWRGTSRAQGLSSARQCVGGWLGPSRPGCGFVVAGAWRRPR
ncbi:hypothetical protein Shyhy01_11660 [Streptomyces hygroscopicus subsp. hygroscopicus]|nr:hypothetical protein Shyhy01_11660 [Streptomyces hygroscopicus subsp. hygroscopicus]